jgi:glycosyltransferase involved in cell wall biosynthesis
MVTIEAFARKTPVIARDLGPLSEIVETSNGGVLFSTDAELQDAVERLSTQPRLARELGEAGYAAFLRHWSREAHLERYFALLGQAADRKLNPTISLPESAPDRVPVFR